MKNCYLRSTVLLLPLLGIPAIAWSSDVDTCTALLKHGIYDKYRETSVSSSASQIYNNICSQYSKLQQDKHSASVQASYTGFGGGGSMSSDQLEAIGSAMCKTDYSAAQAQDDINRALDKISDAGVDAFKECVNLYADGIRSKTLFRESDQAQLTLEVRYVPPPSARPEVGLHKPIIQPDGALRCKGPLFDLAMADGKLGTQSASMSCERVVSPNAFLYRGTRHVFAAPVTLVVPTDSGTITRTLGEIPAGPPETRLTLPIGTLISFSGTLADAELEKKNGWWIADGRKIDDADSPLNMKSTPDLTKRFLLGMKASGNGGGAEKFTISPQTVISYTTGAWSPNVLNVNADGTDPRLVIAGPMGWVRDGHAKQSSGNTPAITVDIIPPYYSVIYLYKVK